MEKQKNGYAVIIAPFTGEEPVSINVSLRKLKIALMVLIAIVMAMFIGIHNIITYRARVADYERVVEENQILQNQVLEFATITEELQKQVDDMKNFDTSIRDMLDGIESESAGVPEASPQVQQQEVKTPSVVLSSSSQRYILGNRHSLSRTLSQVEGNLKELEEQVPQQSSSLESLEEEVTIYTKTLAATPDVWPARGIITSYYGYRRAPLGTGYEFHKGIDIGIDYNTPVVATAPGVIIQRRYIYGYGYYIIVDHGMGFKTLYAHLKKFNCEMGDQVEKGQVIAYSGNSGNSTGPHLHYEVRVNNANQNPIKYLPR